MAAIALEWQPELTKRSLHKNLYKVISLELCAHQVKRRALYP